MNCPTCGVGLHFSSASDSSALGLVGGWQHTALGRVIVGLLLAQGLALGLRMFFDAGFMAAQEQTAQQHWSTLHGVLLLQGLHALGVLLAGGLAGAGRHQGYVLGAIVGLANSLILLGFQLHHGQPLDVQWLYGQPIAQMSAGALGGLLGTLIWKPLPVIQLARPLAGRDPSKRRRSAQSLGLWAGPIAWLRVSLGTVFVIGAVFSPALLVDLLLRASGGELQFSSSDQARWITLEIMGLGVLLGGVWAGTNTRNGVKQGVCAGMTAGSILFFCQLADPQLQLEEILFRTFCILVLCIVGGWFGSRLFPPIISRRSRSRIAFDP